MKEEGKGLEDSQFHFFSGVSHFSVWLGHRFELLNFCGTWIV